MSGALIRVSPTRMAETPAASSRSTSARVRMPLSLTRTTSGGTGQDVQAGRAVGLVGPCDGDRVEVGTDDLGRGAGLLDLGDELDRPRPGQGGAEVADRRGLARLRFQFLHRQADSRCGDLAA